MGKGGTLSLAVTATLTANTMDNGGFERTTVDRIPGCYRVDGRRRTTVDPLPGTLNQ